MLSGTVSLLSQVTPQNEAVIPSVQCCEVVCRSGGSDPRKETTSPAVTHCRQWRRRVGQVEGQKKEQLLPVIIEGEEEWEVERILNKQ